MNWTWTIPEALGDEDGERWYLQGHVDPALAVLAVVLEQFVNDCEPEWVLTGGKSADYDAKRDHADALLASVRHVWVRQDPDNDERALMCEPDHPEAEAWTWVG